MAASDTTTTTARPSACVIDIELCAAEVLDRLVALAALHNPTASIRPEEIEAARSTLVFDALAKARVLDRVIQGESISDAERVAP